MHVEEPGRLDLGTLVRKLAGPRPDRAPEHPLADLVVDVLDVAEERVAAVGEDVGRLPEGQVPAVAQEVERPLVPDAGIDPVPGRRRHHEVERRAGRRPPVLERPMHDLDIRILGERRPSTGRQLGSQLDARDPKAALGERPRRLPRRRPDLEHTIAAPGARDPDKVVEQGRRVLRPGTVVTIGRGIERRSQACGIPHVAG